MGKLKLRSFASYILKPSGIKQGMLTYMLIFGILGGGYMVFKSSASSVPMSNYYANTNRYKAGYYLDGNNYANPTAPSKSVLWFETAGKTGFKQYNSSPYDRCHYDLLNWTNTEQQYTQTVDLCGTNNNKTEYSPGISYMPKYWDDTQTWSKSGTSATTYTNHGVITCKGNNVWDSKVVGWVDLTPTQKAIQLQNNQVTTWTSGSDPSGCKAGFTTKWQENFYLIPNLPINGTGDFDFALKRSVGGNIDTYNLTKKWDYDVWFDSWKKLPVK